MIFIFSLSAQNSSTSSATSGGVIRMLATIFNREFKFLNAEMQQQYIENMQFFVRKAAHFSIYALLGICLSAGFFTFEFKHIYNSALYAWGVGAVYSITDEIHQLYVPGRSGELRDFVIDSLGVAFGCAFVISVYLIYIKIKKPMR